MGRRPDVEILWLAAEEQVANAAADEVGDVLAVAEPVQNFQGIRVDVASRQRVGLAWNDPRFNHREAFYQGIKDRE